MAKHTNNNINNPPNFNNKQQETTLDLDQLEDEPPTTLEKLHKLRVISRQDSIKSSKSNTSGSSGCPSERSSSGTPTTDHLVFDTDFPMGENMFIKNWVLMLVDLNVYLYVLN